MSDNKGQVNQPASASGGTQASVPSGEGQIPSKELEDKVRENLRAEYERKNVELTSQIQELNNRYAELEQKTRLSTSEKKEFATLEDEIAKLESMPEAKAWLAAADKRALSAKEQAKYEIQLDMQKEFLDEKAAELGMDPKQFIQELAVFQGKYSDKNPMQRAKLCLKDWQAQKDFAKREADLKKREDEINGFREDGRHVARDERKITSMDDVKSSADLQRISDSIFDSDAMKVSR